MDIDVRSVAPTVRCPALVFHSQDDARIPFQEGQLLASLIPGARFVPLPGANHLPLEHDPAWLQFLRELDRFLGVVPGGVAVAGRAHHDSPDSGYDSAYR
jgi:pimeloyl-ACP methyl ester carboxylesterase